MPEPKKMFREDVYFKALSALRTRFLLQLPEEMRDAYAEAMGPRQPHDAPGTGTATDVPQALADLEHYMGERGRRGNKLPRGFQNVSAAEITQKK